MYAFTQLPMPPLHERCSNEAFDITQHVAQHITQTLADGAKTYGYSKAAFLTAQEAVQAAKKAAWGR